ncbi:MAG: sigma 54-interacting transcriptional regulator [Solidesulfovibrio sp.]
MMDDQNQPPNATKIDTFCHKKMEAVFECIYEAICVIDTNGIVQTWNKSAERLYHVSSTQIIGHNILEFFPDALVDKVRRTKQAAENVCHSPREGTYILANAMPLYVDGEFCGAVSSDRDYAEVRQLYTALEHAESRLVFLQNEMKIMAGNLGDITGSNPAIVKKIQLARQIAPCNTTVLITGESGTGKEVFARKIHELSGRTGLLVPINCSAIPPELFESEFFGYSPGAFTGASRKGKLGLFEIANEGTVFLDEIGDMPLYMQAKLLRVIQEREILRVGGSKTIKVDVRIISATNKSLKELVREDKFREDLYYRLNVVEINLPPLRERKEDIPLFIDRYIREFAGKNGKPIKGVLREVIDILTAYDWPGNIRELMNVIENIVVTNTDKIISKDSIPDFLLMKLENPAISHRLPVDLAESVRNLEQDNIKKALKSTGNNKAQAARLLGIPRATFYRKLEEYGLMSFMMRDEEVQREI